MINLDAALSIASGGLANVNRHMAIVSQNVANAGTPGYAAEIGTQWSLTADGAGLGVHTGPAIRNLDTSLQAELFSQNATVAGLQTQQTALQSIDAVMGTPGQGGDIASLLGQLQDQFSTLLNNPDSAPQQSQVVAAAATLAQGINGLSDAYTAQRQAAEDSIGSELATLNTTLATIGGLSDKIVALKAAGQSTADLENQRDAALADLSQLVGVKAMEQPNGDLLIATTAGLVLPIHGMANPFAMDGASVQPGTYYPAGGIKPITLAGNDVTGQLRGGRIGANIALRDTTLPTAQAELDEFAQNLASRFDAQGLSLFTDPAGNVPAPAASPLPVQSNYVGFAATIQVNPLVLATPSLVRDGTVPLPVPSPSGGYTGIIQQVLTYTFGPQQASGVAQPASNTSGLGPTGSLNAPYTAPPTLAGIAATLLAAQAQGSATVSTQADTEQAVQTTLAGKLSSESGVNIDAEMSQMIVLQNAYGANARVISTIQTMWTQLLQAVS
ncbi:MAG TPA: flagellar basal body rod C-terminal domain-containing protein [Acetobacteraceae bacterium]|jgi:flagellar hook-associated protein 1 FlgK|nr:flagellar basal body rod C-terminal domain-containing protein [Acetobacteraceae bacterium]